VLLLLVLIGVTNSKGGATRGSVSSTGGYGATSSAQAASGVVVYEVAGTGQANSISYGGTGGISQANGEQLPWTMQASATRGFGVYSLTAQNGGSGAITCRITVNGQPIAQQTSTGQYAVVSCSGSSSSY
jgi:hypothetical protein